MTDKLGKATNKIEIKASASDHEPVDTEEQFHKVFKKLEFDSWDEFVTILDEFQRITGTRFKPKSGSTVEKMNKRRVLGLIPERFRYQTVQMVCVHFGLPQVSEKCKNKKFSYIGLGCEAFFKLSYRQGRLHITQYHLIHTNHAVDTSKHIPIMQSPWAIKFTDDLDLLIARTVLDNRVFEQGAKAKEWGDTVMILQESDPRLLHATQRVIKRRVETLLDKFDDNCLHREILPDDELGNIIQKLWRLRKEKQAQQASENSDDEHSYTSKRRSIVTMPKRSKRKRKLTLLGQSFFMKGKLEMPDDDDDNDPDFEPNERQSGKYCVDDSNVGATVVVADSAGASPACPEKTSTADRPHHLTGLTNVDAFWTYWMRRDGEEWKLRNAEIKLRQEEMALRRKELEFQKQKFEFEKMERETFVQILMKQSENLFGQTVTVSYEDA